jgi:hypothetical protein
LALANHGMVDLDAAFSGHGLKMKPLVPEDLRRPVSILPDGLNFIRHLQCLAQTNDKSDARRLALHRFGERSAVVKMLEEKAAVGVGGVDWASTELSAGGREILGLANQLSVVGRIGNFRKVPFNTRVSAVTAGATGSFTAPATPKPVRKLSLSELITLTPKKATATLIISAELFRVEDQSASVLIRNDLVRAVADAIDTVFLSADAATTAAPAGILSGVTAISASSDASVYVKVLIESGYSGNLDTSVFIARPETWAEFARPGLDIGIRDGTFLRAPALVSRNAPDNKLILLDPTRIAMAAENELAVDVSTDAAVQMDDGPTSPPDANTVLTSLWQENLVGLRAERLINWTAPSGAVGCLSLTT